MVMFPPNLNHRNINFYYSFLWLFQNLFVIWQNWNLWRWRKVLLKIGLAGVQDKAGGWKRPGNWVRRWWMDVTAAWSHHYHHQPPPPPADPKHSILSTSISIYIHFWCWHQFDLCLHEMENSSQDEWNRILHYQDKNCLILLPLSCLMVRILFGDVGNNARAGSSVGLFFNSLLIYSASFRAFRRREQKLLNNFNNKKFINKGIKSPCAKGQKS